MPKSLVNGFTICCFVDSDHAGESLMLRFRSGFIVMLNNAPIYWHSENQTTVETSAFGGEFITMNQAAE